MSNPAAQLTAALVQAQGHIARHEFKAAAALFTRLLADFPTVAPALPVLSRCTCYYELKDWGPAEADALRVLDLPDVQTPEEIIPGCWSTHAAALARLTKIYEHQGRKAKSDEAKKKLTAFQKTSATNIEKALVLKEQGNKLYGEGKLSAAVAKYTESLVLDATNETVWGNLSLMHLKLGEMDKSLEAADKATQSKPTWAKGWLRKGTALKQMKRHLEATTAYHTGLQFCPDDESLKAEYMASSKVSEKAGLQGGGFNQKIMGMMMELRQSSWNMYKWYGIHYASIQALPFTLDCWSSLFTTQTKTPEFARHLNKIMRIIAPKFDAATMTPREVVEPGSKHQDNFSSYFLPSHPLLSVLIFYALTTHPHFISGLHSNLARFFPRFAKSTLNSLDLEDNSMYFSLSFDPHFLGPDARASFSYPHLTETMCFGGIVLGSEGGKEGGIVIDLWTAWEEWQRASHFTQVSAELATLKELRTKQKNADSSDKAASKKIVLPHSWLEKSWFKELMTQSVTFIALKDKNQTVSAADIAQETQEHSKKLEPPVLYTCQSFDRAFEFVRGYYETQKASNPPADTPAAVPSAKAQKPTKPPPVPKTLSPASVATVAQPQATPARTSAKLPEPAVTVPTKKLSEYIRESALPDPADGIDTTIKDPMAYLPPPPGVQFGTGMPQQQSSPRPALTLTETVGISVALLVALLGIWFAV